jgi:ABC-type antimicrobial peptide transport system permease subunit
MSLIPTDTESRASLILVAKLFGAAATIAFGIKFGIPFGITRVMPSFRISAFDDKTLNHIALLAITLPSLMIALILLDRTRKLS